MDFGSGTPPTGRGGSPPSPRGAKHEPPRLDHAGEPVEYLQRGGVEDPLTRDGSPRQAGVVHNSEPPVAAAGLRPASRLNRSNSSGFDLVQRPTALSLVRSSG